jgi:hypothetical protein
MFYIFKYLITPLSLILTYIAINFITLLINVYLNSLPFSFYKLPSISSFNTIIDIVESMLNII